MTKYEINKRCAEILGLNTQVQFGNTLEVWVREASSNDPWRPFNPCNNWQDTGMVIDYLHKEGYSVITDATGCIVVGLNAEFKRINVDGETKTAVCKALIKAEEGNDENEY